MDANKNILYNVSETVEQCELNPSDDLLFYLRVDGVVYYVGGGQLHTVISENKDVPSILQTFHV